MAEDEFTEMTVEPLDLPDTDVSENAENLTSSSENAQKTEKVEHDIQSEQLEAYKKHFSALQTELSGIEERHKNDAKPEDSEAVKELKQVRSELAALKEELKQAKQPQNTAFQPQFYQQPMMNPYPAQMPMQSHFQPFNLPTYQIPIYPPTIPNFNMNNNGGFTK